MRCTKSGALLRHGKRLRLTLWPSRPEQWWRPASAYPAMWSEIRAALPRDYSEMNMREFLTETAETLDAALDLKDQTSATIRMMGR